MHWCRFVQPPGGSGGRPGWAALTPQQAGSHGSNQPLELLFTFLAGSWNRPSVLITVNYLKKVNFLSFFVFWLNQLRLSTLVCRSSSTVHWKPDRFFIFLGVAAAEREHTGLCKPQQKRREEAEQGNQSHHEDNSSFSSRRSLSLATNRIRFLRVQPTFGFYASNTTRCVSTAAFPLKVGFFPVLSDFTL